MKQGSPGTATGQTTPTLQLRPGMAKRMRDLHDIATEVEQAHILGVDRSTLRRVDRGSQPSGQFVALFCAVFDLSPGEAFEVVLDK